MIELKKFTELFMELTEDDQLSIVAHMILMKHYRKIGMEPPELY